MRLIYSALILLLAAVPVSAQTWQSGQGAEAVFAPLRSAFAGADKMIDVADLDGAFVKSAVASGTALTLTVQNASDVEQTITFTPAGGGGAAASEETFIGTLGALTGVVQATFDNLFAITETPRRWRRFRGLGVPIGNHGPVGWAVLGVRRRPD